MEDIRFFLSKCEFRYIQTSVRAEDVPMRLILGNFVGKQVTIKIVLTDANVKDGSNMYEAQGT